MNEKEIIDEIVKSNREGLKAILSGDLVKAEKCEERVKQLRALYWSSEKKRKIKKNN